MVAMLVPLQFTKVCMEVVMPNRKQYDVKRKHKKRKDRIKQMKNDNLQNAKKSTLRNLLKTGSLPKELHERC
jgi:hypothetical protein